MAPYLPLTLLLVLTRSWLLDAWIQARSNERHNTFKLGSHSEDLNFQRLQLESVFNEDVVDYQQDDTLHVGGLYESLSVLPVYDWPDYEFDFTSCRDDECDEQCEIPDNFKGHSSQVDVLEFLGIQRAEPLRVPNKP